jgi:hypothetical protein
MANGQPGVLQEGIGGLPMLLWRQADRWARSIIEQNETLSALPCQQEPKGCPELSAGLFV